MEIQLLRDIRHDTGAAWIADTGHPELSSHQHSSPAVVLENGAPLPGPAQAVHDDIRSHGRGSYCFWHDVVYFSTSDNSDPRTNGKVYEIGFPVPVSVDTALSVRTPSRGRHALVVHWRRVSSSDIVKKCSYTVRNYSTRAMCSFALLKARFGIQSVRTGRGTTPFTERKLSDEWLSVSSTEQTPVQHTPVNLTERNCDTDVMERDLQYAVQVGQNYLANFSGDGLTLAGKVILEIGPGHNFGSVLLLACMGAKVMVVDRFIPAWDPQYHPKFYLMLRDWMGANLSDANLAPVERIIRKGFYCPESILGYACALEELSPISDSSVDIVVSNAVLEHLSDPEAAFRNLARISKPGGKGYHQVDFRDHRDFSKPLEFLLWDDDTFTTEFAQRNGECGNRFRPNQYDSLFKKVGFEVKRFVPTCLCDQTYLDNFMTRLRYTSQSRYSEVNKGDLSVMSGHYVLEKKGNSE